jgi:hypothetical protein
MKVTLLDHGDIKHLKIRELGKSWGMQLDSSQILEKTFYTLPKDAYSYMCLVDQDLYRDGFNHVVAVSNFKS